MRKKWVFLILSIVTVFSAAGVSFASNTIKLVVNGMVLAPDVPPQIINDRTMVPIRWVGEALGAQVAWNGKERTVTIDTPDQQKSLQRQIELLQHWIAPQSPEEAVQTWAEAIKARNGAVQYAVLSPALQKKTRKQFEELNWVTGVSSPWVDSYTVSEGVQTGVGERAFDVLFKLATSTGSAGEGTLKVTVRQSDDQWSLSGIQAGTGGDLGITVIPSASDEDSSRVVLQKPQGVQMIDNRNGWAWGIQQNKLVLMRTTDGGAHWKQVPSENLGAGAVNEYFHPTLYFADENTGWMSWSDDKKMTVARTTDAGKHWSKVTFPGYDHPVSLCFTDERHGWILTSGEAAMHHSQKKVYRTVDGGQSWKVVSSNTGYIPGDSPTKDALPQEGHSTGLVFINDQEGFVSMDNPVSSKLLLYKTADGGKTWKAVSLNVPQSIDRDYVYSSISAPVFSGDHNTDGVVVVKFGYDDKVKLAAYHTNDGGDTWSGTAFPGNIKVERMENLVFADVNSGWLVSDGSLYQTEDGGKSWNKVRTDSTFTQTVAENPVILQFQFADDQSGWLLDMSENQSGTKLIRTDDGGKTWKVLTVKD